jgi:hypothetical protein
MFIDRNDRRRVGAAFLPTDDVKRELEKETQWLEKAHRQIRTARHELDAADMMYPEPGVPTGILPYVGYLGPVCGNLHWWEDDYGRNYDGGLRLAPGGRCYLCELGAPPFLAGRLGQPGWKPKRLYDKHYFPKRRILARDPDGLVAVNNPTVIGLLVACYERLDMLRWFDDNGAQNQIDLINHEALQRGISRTHYTRMQVGTCRTDVRPIGKTIMRWFPAVADRVEELVQAQYSALGILGMASKLAGDVADGGTDAAVSTLLKRTPVLNTLVINKMLELTDD